ncbi:MAG: alpha-amylase family glycosyl hydrolase [Candidatus Competibacteraceae bacterium]
MSAQLQWWQRGTIYQILVRSFMDSNGDGQGDLPGIISKLDYLQWLGVDAIWLSPIYPSPWADFGYDVSDYNNVHPAFGTLEAFDRLVAEAHARGIKVLLDWVPNHTSDQHPWFQESRASRDNPKRNWYIWADPKPDGSPPNNWLSVFDGSAWTLDPTTGQYYFHAFLPQQPDLNWRNPEVRDTLCENLRFWLRRGVDGFRIDAIDMLVEDKHLRDNPPNPYFKEGDAPDRAVIQEHTRDQPGAHKIIVAMRHTADEFRDRILLGEMYIAPEQVVSYYGTSEQPELHLPLNLQLLWRDWDSDQLTDFINEYYRLVPAHGWPTWSLGNHDKNRLASRAQGDQARVAALLLLTLRGTPTLYYGDEVGLHDVAIPPDKVEDPQAKTQPERNRDVARTPMQWDNSNNAGFTTGEPWLPVASDYRAINVAFERDDPRSLLNLYQRLLELRKSEPALTAGSYVPVERQAPVVAYRRETEDQRLLVLLNLSANEFSFGFGGSGRILLSTFLDRENKAVQDVVTLRANEGLLIDLS